MPENKIEINKYPNIFKGHQYALDVISGKITANIYIIASCKRYLKDLERDDLYFDYEWAEKFLVTFQKFEHVIGEWETPNLVLEPWQLFFFMVQEGFYWKRNNKRKYKTSHLEVARGNGKSAIASVTGLIYLRLVKVLKGNKVYAVATKKEQARIVLDSSRAMAKANSRFLKKTGVEVFAHHIAHSKSESEFRALSSDSKSLDGLQPVLAVVDELHAHKTRDLYDVVDSAMSKRPDSLLLVITTAGFSLDGIGHSQSSYAKKVSLGEIQDESFWAMVFTLDEKDDWRDEKNWIKANPNLNVSVDIDSFRSKAFKAQANPQDEINFKVKHLNIWQNALAQYFTIKKWKDLGNENLKIGMFKSEKCFVGIDLASKIDLTSIAYVFRRDEKYYIFSDNYCPEQTVEESDNVMYSSWVDTGELIATPGAAINYIKLREDFLIKSKMVKLEDVFYDPWSATEFAQQLSKKRVSVTEFRMSVANLSEPMKRLEALIREGKVIHNGSTLLSWCLGNVVAKVDHNDNVFPRKEHESMKIDPIISILMALAGWINEEENESVYETRGIRVL